MGGEPLAPEAIDLGFVPRFRDGVELVEVAEEAVLYEEDSGQLHRFDTIATIVAALFDGERTLGEVVDLLDDAFEEAREVIEADVLAMVRELGGKGVLDGVATSEDGPGTQRPSGPEGDGGG